MAILREILSFLSECVEAFNELDMREQVLLVAFLAITLTMESDATRSRRAFERYEAASGHVEAVVVASTRQRRSGLLRSDPGLFYPGTWWVADLAWRQPDGSPCSRREAVHEVDGPVAPSQRLLIAIGPDCRDAIVKEAYTEPARLHLNVVIALALLWLIHLGLRHSRRWR